MRSELIVRWGAGDEVVLPLGESAAMPHDEARAWLDREFVRLDGAPRRPTGKVLGADKVLGVAEAAGRDGFADRAWARDFARAAAGALGKPVVVDDVPAWTVGY